MGVNKGLVADHPTMIGLITGDDMDGSSYLNLIRLGGANGGDISASQSPGSIARTLYVNLVVVPLINNNPSPKGTDKVYNTDRALFLDPAHPNSDTESNDIYLAQGYGSAQITTAGGYTCPYLDASSSGPSGEGPFVLTSRGVSKIHNVIAACYALKTNHNWNIGFGFTNEPNNLAGYRIPGPWKYWWPMTAKAYASGWRAVMNYVAYWCSSQYNWAPPLVFGEVSAYDDTYCYLLDGQDTSYNRVPPGLRSQGLTFPDV